MEITIDLSRFAYLADQSLGSIVWYIFSHGGWLILLLFILYIIYINWFFRRRRREYKKIPQTMLAIDIPKDNEQSLVAVEQIFAHLAGIRTKPNLIEKYIHAEIPLFISLEIISLEGYIQFLIRTPYKFKDLVEAAIYAQYPEAEITEVEDYVSIIPLDIYKAHSDYKLWGTEFKLEKNNCYPIKTYRNFEHSLSQTFTDPMGALLVVMSKLGKGEQLGVQLLIQPVSDDWKETGYNLEKKLIGEKIESKDHIGDKMINGILKGMEYFSESIIQLWGDIEDKDKNDRDIYNLIQYLTPGEKDVVEGIQRKLSQICFKTKFRVFYLAHNEVFQKGRGVNSIAGAINQFNTSNLNAFERNKNIETKIDYFFKKSREALRQKELIRNYKERSFEYGSTPFILSIEELATLYHFPAITVKAPLLEKTEAKKAGPPTSLPAEVIKTKEYFKQAQEIVEESEKEYESDEFVSPDEEVSTEPTYKITQSLPGYDFDNYYYESKFAKDKAKFRKKNITKELKKESAEPPANLPILEE